MSLPVGICLMTVFLPGTATTLFLCTWLRRRSREAISSVGHSVTSLIALFLAYHEYGSRNERSRTDRPSDRSVKSYNTSADGRVWFCQPLGAFDRVSCKLLRFGICITHCTPLPTVTVLATSSCLGTRDFALARRTRTSTHRSSSWPG